MRLDFLISFIISYYKSSIEERSRIVNGKLAPKFKYDFMAHINNYINCGGVFLRNDVVLTAAHCIDSSKYKKFNKSDLNF